MKTEIETCFYCGEIVLDRAAIRYCNPADTITIALHDACALQLAHGITEMAERGQELLARN